MGSSTWSNDFYVEKEATRKATNTPTFAYDAAVKSGKVAREVHAKLQPKGVKFREARDSKEHPESVPIGFILDVTGSMHGVPRVVQRELPKLNSLLTKTGYVKDPQILFGAVGDARSDKGSFQVGQFESGIEMDDDISNLWLEGGGGGGEPQESYQNALYFFARHTSTDSFEKRGKKGYLFLAGDEKAYPEVDRNEVEAIFGDHLQENIPLADIVKEVQEKFHVFFLFAQNTSHGRDPNISAFWEKTLGKQYVLPLQDESSICEAIALAVGLTEGNTTVDKAASELGSGNVPNVSVGSLLEHFGAPKGVGAKTVRL